MKKKEVKSDGESVPVVDLKALIHQHSLFFDKLVELIPARFYLPTDENKPWFQGLSKEEKTLSKKETKENLKSVRRDRLDPEKSSTTTLDLLKQNLEKEKLDNERHDDDDNDEIDDDDKNILSGLDDGNNRSVTYEELQQRLRRRIEEFRGDRNAGCSRREQKRKERSERRGVSPSPSQQQQKRKRAAGSGDREAEPGKDSSGEKTERAITEASNELAFGHVKLGNDGDGKKKRRLSKHRELDMARELEEAKKDPERGSAVSEKHSWSAAASRAAGAKVHDDLRLLSKSIQKEKRRQQKNAQKWKERVQTTNKLKADRQKKRSGNIQAKKDNKKQRKIEKREKKLMRPGFEGRKEGFINEGTA